MSDHSNPLAVTLPHVFSSPQEYPTEVLALRFQAWRSIIKDLVNYLKEYASVQEEILRQQLRLQQAVGISASSHSHGASGHSHSASVSSAHKEDINAINKFFLPIGNGSVQDLPTILTKYHQQNVTNASKTLKDVNQVIIPKLEEVRKDLLLKIKEIKNLQNDFKNNLAKELAETKNLLNQYVHAFELSEKLEHGQSPHAAADDLAKYDPYLVKIRLERQLKRQLSEEHYLYEAYNNLQTAGGKLESIIVLEIQNYLRMFLDLLVQEHSTIPGFLQPNLSNGFLLKEATFEWDSFISKHLPSPSISVSALGHNNSSVKNGTFVDLSFPSRKMADLAIPNLDSPLNIAVREGYLERRTKFLKSYSTGWYVLTCNYFHEFKSPDRKKDPVPVHLILLDHCVIAEHSKDDGKPTGVYKFVVQTKLLGTIMSKGHNFAFRTDTYKNMIAWYNDIKALTSLPTGAARARYVEKNYKPSHLRQASRNSSILLTATRSVMSGTTQSRLGAKTPRSRPLSQVSSTANHRLSSTFSQKNNNQSPRLTNMINSDGTIITPVETSNYASTPVQPGIPVQLKNGLTYVPTYQYYEQVPGQQQISQQPLTQQPQPGQSQQGQPQVQVTQPQGQGNGQSGQPQQPGQPGQPVQPGQAGQTFYDPVQQQFYTISPSLQPQPQFFPASPPAQASGQVYPINTANYFPQYHDGASAHLPYPVNHHASSSSIEPEQEPTKPEVTIEEPQDNSTITDIEDDVTRVTLTEKEQ